MKPNYNLAIIGVGPRGLCALEHIIKLTATHQVAASLKIALFEIAKNPGAGQVWNLEQPECNWVNISDRALKDLEGRKTINFDGIKIPSFPSLTDWLESEQGHKLSDKKDGFPPRAIIGLYLFKRFESIYEPLKTYGTVVLIKEQVKALNIHEFTFDIVTSSGTYNALECLLTIGHQSTEYDEQIKEWLIHAANKNFKIIERPYNPSIANHVESDIVVAMRGFGLATIDVIRLLTIERGAKFTKKPDSHFLDYHASERSVKTMIPFSLDGLPMMPKPLGNNVDRYFEPTNFQKKYFEITIKQHLEKAPQIEDLKFLLNTFAAVCIEVYVAHPQVDNRYRDEVLKDLTTAWLSNMSMSHELILNQSIDCLTYMKEAVCMAMGTIAPSLDYTIGQVWRHLQPSMYALFSHCGLDDELMEELTALDESTKRYSFGPPVASIQQLIALADAAVLQLDFLKDPAIEKVEAGWNLQLDSKESTATVMINTILSAPVLKEINAPLVTSLLKDDNLKPVTSNLGIDTMSNGLVILDSGQVSRLATLGRNSKGSVLGVDAILECFGNRIEDWAIDASERILVV